MKKNIKRFLAFFIVLTMIFTTTVFAFPGNGRGIVNNPNLEKLSFKFSFNDLTGYEWASKSIETMSKMGLVKGVGNNDFAPASASKEIEVIIMTLRILELIDEDDIDFKSFKDWTEPYLQKAVDSGIILEEELAAFNPNRAASRLKTAVYIIRALDMVEEAENHMDENLPFLDSNSIPNEYIGYIYLINKMGLMIGNPNGTFQPNKPITRAELAILFERITDSDYIDNDDYFYVRGYILSLDLEDEDDMSIDIRVSNKTYTYDINKNVDVYDTDDDLMDIENLVEGDRVKLLVKNDKVIVIELLQEAAPSPVSVILTGILVDLDLTDDPVLLTIDLDNSSSDPAEFELDEDAIISAEFNDNQLVQEHEGLRVRVRAIDDVVTRVQVYYRTLEGVLENFDENDMEIQVLPEGETEEEIFILNEDIILCINEENVATEDLDDLDFEDDDKYFTIIARLLGNDEIIHLCIKEFTIISGEFEDFSEDDNLLTGITVNGEDYDMADEFEVFIGSELLDEDEISDLIDDEFFDYIGEDIEFVVNYEGKVIRIKM
jgi:hypothetical protein